MPAALLRRKRRPNQALLVALMEMGIPKHKAEVALEETGNVGIEVATEWLFSAPERLLEQLSSDGGSPSSTSSMSSSEETIVTTPKRVPLKGVRCAAKSVLPRVQQHAVLCCAPCCTAAAQFVSVRFGAPAAHWPCPSA